MTDKELKLAIRESIVEFKSKPPDQAAVNLFKTLGYNTDRQNPFTEKTFDFFKESFLGSDSNFNEDIKNIFREGELDEKVSVRKFRITTQHGAIAGKTQEVDAEKDFMGLMTFPGSRPYMKDVVVAKNY